MTRRKDQGVPGNGGQYIAREQGEAGVSLTGDLDAKTKQTLADFLDFAESGVRLIARGRVAYDGDEMLRFAAEAVLHRIGEAVSRLDIDFTKAHPQVNWRPMKGMRNLVAHDYGAVDYNIVWNALERDLPLEAAEVRRILDGSS